jgi:imidazolonepropionase-like amidohydrolase
MSIHNQESPEETRFFKGEKSGFEDLYRFLGMDISWFKAPGISSLRYFIEASQRASTMLVHNTYSNAEDVALAGENAWWCFCPAANKYIEDRLPQFELFAGRKEKICIGTDSLASNSSLDPLREVNLILSHTDIFSPEDLLRAITYNAASAIGLDADFGHLRGNKAGLNLVRFNHRQIQFIQKIT